MGQPPCVPSLPSAGSSGAGWTVTMPAPDCSTALRSGENCHHLWVPQFFGLPILSRACQKSSAGECPANIPSETHLAAKGNFTGNTIRLFSLPRGLCILTPPKHLDLRPSTPRLSCLSGRPACNPSFLSFGSGKKLLGGYHVSQCPDRPVGPRATGSITFRPRPLTRPSPSVLRALTAYQIL